MEISTIRRIAEGVGYASIVFVLFIIGFSVGNGDGITGLVISEPETGPGFLNGQCELGQMWLCMEGCHNMLEIEYRRFPRDDEQLKYKHCVCSEMCSLDVDPIDYTMEDFNHGLKMCKMNLEEAIDRNIQERIDNR